MGSTPPAEGITPGNVVRIAVLPVDNLSGSAAPLREMRDELLKRLRGHGFELLEETAFNALLTRHRVRYTGGLDTALAAAFRDEEGVAAVLVVNLELYNEGSPPKLAFMARLVETAATPRIIWMESFALAGNEHPGAFELGLVDSPVVIRQLLLEVDWGELDDLVIDFPPGTGDAQLTISQTIKMTGVVVVSTPNDLALIDALKAIAMFRKVEVPVLGLVENMAWFECPHCQERTDIFGRGLVDRAAAEQEVPILGRIPIDPQVVAESDAGVPVVAARPESAAGRAYTAIAEATLAAAATGSAPPRPRGLGAFFDRFGKG